MPAPVLNAAPSCIPAARDHGDRIGYCAFACDSRLLPPGRCENAPQVCADKREGKGEAKVEVWPSKEACCRAGLGAYTDGCSVLASFF
jgi:hypothetical protein